MSKKRDDFFEVFTSECEISKQCLTCAYSSLHTWKVQVPKPSTFVHCTLYNAFVKITNIDRTGTGIHL